MTEIMNALDSHAERLDCAFINIHHSSKGDQSNKSVTDVGAGAGVLSRAVDTHITLRPHELEDFATRFKPQLMLVSAGFDSHREDPIGSLDLETEDFRELTRVVLDVAAAHCEGKIVSVLEGGYHPRALAESVEAHLSELLDRSDQ